jgi:hypothetical protein
VTTKNGSLHFFFFPAMSPKHGALAEDIAIHFLQSLNPKNPGSDFTTHLPLRDTMLDLIFQQIN